MYTPGAESVHGIEACFSLTPPLAPCLEKEVGEVKATLQTMLLQLRVAEEEDEDEDGEDVNEALDAVDLMEDETEDELEGGEEGEEEEDQYFSDSWDI